DVPTAVRNLWMTELSPVYDQICRQHPGAVSPFAMRQLGTLGTGNHFVELTTDSIDGHVGLVIHSGSRGLGNKIGSHFTAIARHYCEQNHIGLPDRDLAFLPRGTTAFDDYLE